MPKVISRGVLSTGGAVTASDSQALSISYCLCGQFILVNNLPLESLPRRPIDGSYVLTNDGPERLTYKLSVDEGETVMVKRENGYELQRKSLYAIPMILRCFQ